MGYGLSTGLLLGNKESTNNEYSSLESLEKIYKVKQNKRLLFIYFQMDSILSLAWHKVKMLYFEIY